MKIRSILLLGIFFILSTLLSAQGSMGKAKPFSTANIHFERNATDGDVEAVLEVIADDDGLVKLSVMSPDGKNILKFEASEKSVLGIRQFRFESPEPKNEESLKAAYPEGSYTFNGTTARGKMLSSKSVLNHKFPLKSTVIEPKDDTNGLNTSDLKISWSPVKDITTYMVYIEHDDFSFTATLPDSKTSLTVPGGYLQPNTKYMIGIGTVSINGNTTFIESSFTTGDK